MRNIFRPDCYYPDIFAVEPRRLRRRGIRLVIIDMDNTLVSAVETEIPPRVRAYVADMKASGIIPVVMSNNVSGITARRCAQLDIDFFSFSLKPLRKGYRRVLKKYGLKPQQTAVIGDQVLTDIAGGSRMGILTILVDPLTDQNNIFGKGVRMISETLCFLLKDMPRKGEYYGNL